MKNFAAASTDYLLEVLAWSRDRRNYCRECGKPAPNDLGTVSAILSELGRRGGIPADIIPARFI